MLALLLLCLCLSSTLAVPATSSMYMGRSADIIIESEIHQDSVIFFRGQHYSTTNINKLESTRFADLFAHVMGTQPFHLDADRTGFPTSSLFYKPRASVIVAIDSVGSEILSKYSALSFTQSSRMSTITTPSSSPINTQTILANMVTGTTPSKHGIVGPAWRRAGALVNAYDHENGMSFAANVADILLQETAGRSLVISASSSASFASALGAHPEMVMKNAGWNAHAYSYDAKKGAFASVYARPSTEQVLSFSVADFSSEVVLGGARFSPMTPEDNALLVELAFVRNMISTISAENGPFSALVKDDMPDLYSFVFASLKGIEAKYGKDSETYSAALTLVDKAISSLLSAINHQYDDRVVSSVIALNARDLSSQEVKDSVYNKVSTMLYDAKDFSSFYPNLYVRSSEFSGYARNIICSNLQKAVADSNANVYCSAPLVSSRSTRALDADGNGTCNYNKTSPYAESDLRTVWAFWLNFFITLILIAFVAWGAYCLAFVGSDASKDSLLFRAAGRHHHQN